MVAASSRWRALSGVPGVGVAYGLSIVALLVGEVSLARSTGAADFGTYSLARTAVPLVVAVGLLGYDQALTREVAVRGGRGARFSRREGLRCLRVGVVGAAVAAYLVVVVDVPWVAGVSLVAATASVAVSTLVSGVMRASGRSTSAALGQQGYRLIGGTGLIVMAGHLDGPGAVVLLATGAAVVAVACLSWSRRIADPWRVDRDEHRGMVRLGYGYTLGLVSMAGSDWLDQALVAQGGSVAAAGGYAADKLLTVYPLLSVGSVLGFLALPAVARRRDHLRARSFLRWVLVAVAATAALWLVVALVVSQVDGRITRDISPSLLLVLTAVGALRLLYVLPSAVLGATASSGTLLRFGCAMLACVALQAAATVALSPLGWPLAAAYGLLLVAVARVCVSIALAVRTLSGTREAARPTEGAQP